jgi:hypothetical protein
MTPHQKMIVVLEVLAMAVIGLFAIYALVA